MDNLQGTPEWFEIRRGKFTASEAIKLLTGGRRDMTAEELAEEKKNGGKRKTIDTMFGDVAIKYIQKKAREIVFGYSPDDELNTPDIQRGRELEPLAFNKLVELKGKEFIEVKKCFFLSMEGFASDVGASPDAIVGENIAEIKCPKIDKFFRLVIGGKKEIDEIGRAHV